jgi:hypothetical protein
MPPQPAQSPLVRWLWIAALVAVVGWAFWRSQPVVWERFEPPGGRFSVEMPAEPQSRTQQVKTAAGEIPLHLFALESGPLSYMASYSDYPESIFAASTPQKMLDGARNGAAVNIQGTVESERQISIDGFPARAVVLGDSTGELLLEMRLILVERRLYQLGVLSARSSLGSKDAIRFLDSFVLMPAD